MAKGNHAIIKSQSIISTSRYFPGSFAKWYSSNLFAPTNILKIKWLLLEDCETSETTSNSSPFLFPFQLFFCECP